MHTRSIIMLLASLFLFSALPTSAQMYSRQFGQRAPWRLKSYMMVGARELDIGDLNDQLTAAGYEAFSTTFLTMGGGLEFSIRRFMFGWEGAALMTSGEESVDGTIATELMGGEGLFNVGYEIVSRRSFSLFPMVGFGAGAMQVSFRPAAAPAFGDILADPQRMAKISAYTALVNLGLGAEYLVPVLRFWGIDGGIVLGLRAGYLFSALSSNWRFDTTSIPGGPDLDISGPYARATFGLGARSAITRW